MPRLVMRPVPGASRAGAALLIPAYGFLPILAVSTGFGTLFWTLGPLAESAILQSAVDYGRVKFWGSLTFLIMTVVIGRVLVSAPRDMLLALLLVGAALVLATISLLPTPTRTIQR